MADEKSTDDKSNSPNEVDYNSVDEDGSLRIKIICLGDSAVGKSKYECPKCGKDMVLRERKGTIDGYKWRCCTKGGENPHDVCKSGVRKGKIVEIDESLFGKMKYGKGKPVNGQWVLGGVERNSNKCFVRVVPNQTKEELLSVIKEWVVPGSIINLDCWKAYNCLLHEGYQHLQVNHSLTFMDPKTGAHTNSIEGTCSAIKGRVGQRCTLNLSRAETSSRWCGVVVRRGGASSGVVHVT
ncbi:putative isxo2-like transposase domain protein [Trichonephila clavipes]|nr:putative isxo2-like transposase domain protein [Trichonephila clavipes]